MRLIFVIYQSIFVNWRKVKGESSSRPPPNNVGGGEIQGLYKGRLLFISWVADERFEETFYIPECEVAGELVIISFDIVGKVQQWYAV